MDPRARLPLAPLTAVAAFLVPITGGTASAGSAYEYRPGRRPRSGRSTGPAAPPPLAPPGGDRARSFGDSRSLPGNLSPALEQDGYRVHPLDHGNRATGPIEEYAHPIGCTGRPSRPGRATAFGLRREPDHPS